jgi:hypothetical protein
MMVDGESKVHSLKHMRCDDWQRCFVHYDFWNNDHNKFKETMDIIMHICDDTDERNKIKDGHYINAFKPSHDTYGYFKDILHNLTWLVRKSTLHIARANFRECQTLTDQYDLQVAKFEALTTHRLSGIPDIKIHPYYTTNQLYNFFTFVREQVPPMDYSHISRNPYFSAMLIFVQLYGLSRIYDSNTAKCRESIGRNDGTRVFTSMTKGDRK